MSHTVVNSILGVGGDFTLQSMTVAERYIAFSDIMRELKSPYYIENVMGDHTKSLQLVTSLENSLSMTLMQGPKAMEVLRLPVSTMNLTALLGAIRIKRESGSMPYDMLPVLNVNSILAGPLTQDVYRLVIYLHHSGHYYLDIVDNSSRSYKPDGFVKLVDKFEASDTSRNKTMVAFKEQYGNHLGRYSYLVAPERYLCKEAASAAAVAVVEVFGKNRMLNSRIPK